MVDGNVRSQTSEIVSLAEHIQKQLDEAVPALLERRGSEFQTLFEEVGDSAYGAMNTALFAPIRSMLSAAGLVAKPRLPGGFQTSREWGNHDESHQQRWMWSVIHKIKGPPIGTLAVGSHHSHLQFEVPRGPEVIGLYATTPAAIVSELSAILPEFGKAQDFRAWYVRYVAEQTG
jgi:hypothetical protein